MTTEKENTIRPAGHKFSINDSLKTTREEYTTVWVLKYRALDEWVTREEMETYEKAKSMFEVATSWSSEAVLYKKVTRRYEEDTELEYFKKEEDKMEVQ
jgi:hypothetical protein